MSNTLFEMYNEIQSHFNNEYYLREIIGSTSITIELYNKKESFEITISSDYEYNSKSIISKFKKLIKDGDPSK